MRNRANSAKDGSNLGGEEIDEGSLGRERKNIRGKTSSCETMIGIWTWMVVYRRNGVSIMICYALIRYIMVAGF